MPVISQFEKIFKRNGDLNVQVKKIPTKIKI